MRISTAQFFANGLGIMQQRQLDLSHTQQQLGSGKRILSPSDDPAGAVEALRLREHLDALAQYQRNADAVLARLHEEESTLEGMREIVQRVRELAVQANNAVHNDDTRGALAGEIRELTDQFLALANTRAPNGEYLFAGLQSGTRPFARGPQGEVDYAGDAGARRVAIAPSRFLAMEQSGEAFMTLPSGNGAFRLEPDADNAGTAHAVLSEAASGYDGGHYRVVFGADGAYEVLDEDDVVLADGAFVAGETIELEGVRVAFSGEPAAGDVFHVRPSGPRSLFAIFDALVTALEAPAATPAERARLHNEVGGALLELDQGLSRVVSLQQSTGSRLQAVEVQRELNEETSLHLQTALSSVEDLDYAEAIGRFQLQLVGLQAAQQTYAELGRLSLFDFLR